MKAMMGGHCKVAKSFGMFSIDYADQAKGRAGEEIKEYKENKGGNRKGEIARRELQSTVILSALWMPLP